MKTYLKLMLLAVASFAVTMSANAQRGFDTYANPRTAILASPALFSGGGAFTSGTNTWFDVKSFDGVAKIDIICSTNVANSSFTISLQGSTDSTNIVALPLMSVATATTVVSTNNYYGGGTNAFSFTNVYNLPGAITVPTSSTAGFATPYLNPVANPFTNSVTGFTPAQGGVTTIGINIQDAPRYLRLIVIPAGAATNGVVGAVLTGFGHVTGYPF